MKTVSRQCHCCVVVRENILCYSCIGILLIVQRIIVWQLFISLVCLPIAIIYKGVSAIVCTAPSHTVPLCDLTRQIVVANIHTHTHINTMQPIRFVEISPKWQCIANGNNFCHCLWMFMFIALLLVCVPLYLYLCPLNFLLGCCKHQDASKHSTAYFCYIWET